MRRWGWLSLVLLAGCGPRIFLLGDSITAQYGLAFKADTPTTAQVEIGGGNSQDPVTYDWKAELQAKVVTFHPATVVLQDYAIPGVAPANITPEQYAAAWVDLVNTAQGLGLNVVVLVGCCNPELMNALGADSTLAMAPADAPDGIHYQSAGAEAMAQLLKAHLGL